MSAGGYAADNPGGNRAESQIGTPVNLRWRYYNPVQRDYVTFLKTSEQTGGEYSLLEVEVAPGGRNIPHYHKTCDEHFEVLRGTLEVSVGKDTLALRAGDKAIAPKNTLHDFRNRTSEPATFLVELRPGQPGFEKALRIAYGLAADGRVFRNGAPSNLYHLALLLEWSEVRLPGLFTVIEPLIRLLARRARRKGIDRALEARYCR